MDKEPMLEFSKKVKIGDYNVSYVKLGSGPTPIFCFPGLLGSMRYSSGGLLERLASSDGGNNYTVYTWDPPGYFLSRNPPRKDSDISFEAEVELSIQLLKHLGHDKWILMGWSAGGQVAIQLTVKYPELVQKLIVWGTWDLFEDDHLPVHLKHSDVKAMDPKFLEEQLEGHGMTHEEFEKTWRLWADMIGRDHFNKDKAQWVKKFEKIKCPTLIVAGSDDDLGPVAQAHHLHEHITTSRLEIIDKAPHWMQFTHLEQLFLLFSNFLK